ncbi:MAG: bifunctional nuclease family protein [Actinomycetota bacterium]|nr:bifunctional nuclease family protein [Actinomycetota bacterium]
MPADLVQLMVSEVNVAVPAGPGVEAGMVVLAEVEEPRRRLRIVIAQPEARAIQAAWTGVIPVRPSTWDLFVSAVAVLEGRLDRMVITAVEEDRHFFAHLEMERAGERRTLPCRPSDAVAVALRAYGAEMYATTAVMDSAGLAEDGTKYGPWVRPEAEPVVPFGEAGGGDASGVAAEVGDPSPGDAAAGDRAAARARRVGTTRSGRPARKARRVPSSSPVSTAEVTPDPAKATPDPAKGAPTASALPTSGALPSAQKAAGATQKAAAKKPLRDRPGARSDPDVHPST